MFEIAQTGVVYSGADDSFIKGWDYRAGTATPIFVNRKAHSAGVCTVHCNRFDEHVIATGSYDETLRVWDVRKASCPLVTEEVRNMVSALA